METEALVHEVSSKAHRALQSEGRHQTAFSVRRIPLLLGGLFLAVASSAQSGRGCASPDEARRIVSAALAAQGGEAKLRAIHVLHLEAFASRNWVEQSERPEGPYIPDFQHVDEIRDYGKQLVRREVKIEIPSFPLDPSTSTWMADPQVAVSLHNGAWVPAPISLVDEAAEILAFSPERILLSASESDALRCEPDRLLGSVTHHVIVFNFHGSPVRVLINAHTQLPAQVESSGATARSGFWRFLGDINMQVRWTTWSIANGVHYPRQWNIERNGLPDQVICVQKLELNPSLDPKQTEIPEDSRQEFAKNPPNSDVEAFPFGAPDSPPQINAPGVVTVRGAWNVTFVEQPDGIVILDAPISSGFSAKAIADAEHTFPGKKVKAVISTSDAWPHVAGLREYVARGIPIYALDLNRTIIERILNEPRTRKPDALSQNHRNPVIYWIGDKTVFGAGPNRMEIYPLRGATTERQMMVYFPERQLLYGSDAFQRQPELQLWLPQTVNEVLDAVQKHRLKVKKFFMMHMDLSDWNQLQADFQKAIAP